jgi:hypothetical protein
MSQLTVASSRRLRPQGRLEAGAQLRGRARRGTPSAMTSAWSEAAASAVWRAAATSARAASPSCPESQVSSRRASSACRASSPAIAANYEA